MFTKSFISGVVVNAAARSVAGLRRSESDHITENSSSFHWLQAFERIGFKPAVTVHRVIHGTVLCTSVGYLPDLVYHAALLHDVLKVLVLKRHLRPGSAADSADGAHDIPV